MHDYYRSNMSEIKAAPFHNIFQLKAAECERKREFIRMMSVKKFMRF
jgi:hypothetical protein